MFIIIMCWHQLDVVTHVKRLIIDSIPYGYIYIYGLIVHKVKNENSKKTCQKPNLKGSSQALCVMKDVKVAFIADII